MHMQRVNPHSGTLMIILNFEFPMTNYPKLGHTLYYVLPDKINTLAYIFVLIL
jgi:hypothetical protein